MAFGFYRNTSFLLSSTMEAADRQVLLASEKMDSPWFLVGRYLPLKRPFSQEGGRPGEDGPPWQRLLSVSFFQLGRRK